MAAELMQGKGCIEDGCCGGHRVALSSVQKAIWVDQALHAKLPIYNTGQILHLYGPIDAELFAAALQRAIDECDALRLRFHVGDETVLQSAAASADHGLIFRDYLAAAHPEAEARDWIAATFWHPIDPAQFPLFAFALVRISKDHSMWLQKYHHLIIDAAGRQHVAKRVAEHYSSLVGGCKPPLSEQLQFLQSPELEASYLASPQYRADKVFWSSQLKDSLPVRLWPRPSRSERERSGRSRRQRMTLPPPHAMDDGAMPKPALRISFKTMALLVWSYFAQNYGARDLTIGVAVAGRSAEQASAVGLYSKVLPLRLCLGLDMTPGEGSRIVGQALRELLVHQRYPVSEIGTLSPLRDHRRMGMFDVVLNYVRTSYDFTFEGHPVECENLSSGFFAPWVVMVLDDSGPSGLQVVVDYDPGLVSDDDAIAFLRCVRTLHDDGGKAVETLEGLAGKMHRPRRIDEEDPRNGLPDRSPANGDAAAPGLVRDMLAVWQDYLDGAVGADDNFFEIGGTSLRAIAIIQRCNEKFGTDIPVMALFEAPTPRQLANYIHVARPGRHGSTVITLRDAQDEAAMVLVHPIDGTLFCYHELVRLMRGRTILGVAGSEVVGQRPADVDSIEALAAQYAAAIVTTLGARPWHIAGFSIGGILAFEIAGAVSSPQKPRTVVLLDTPVRFDAMPEDDASAGEPRIVADLAAASFAHEMRRLRNAYRPRPTNANVILVRAMADPRAPYHDFAWRPYVNGEYNVLAVATDHLGMLQAPGVGRVAGIMLKTMAASDASIPA